SEFGSTAWNIDLAAWKTSWAMLFVRAASLLASALRSIGGGGGISAGGVGRLGSSLRIEAVLAGASAGGAATVIGGGSGRMEAVCAGAGATVRGASGVLLGWLSRRRSIAARARSLASR